MRVLAFDTTVSACSVALWCDGAIEAENCQSMMHGQAEALVPAIESVLDEAQCSYDLIDRIAVTIGPGSFTGVRVGLATARGLGIAMERPVIGIETTAVLAEETREKTKQEEASPQPIIVALDARRAELYVHRFGSDGTALEDPVCILPEETATLLEGGHGLIVGDGAKKLVPLLGDRYAHSDLMFPHPGILAAMAAKRHTPSQPPRPLYVRPPDAALPKSGGRLRP